MDIIDPVDFYYEDSSSERETVGVEDSISVAGNIQHNTVSADDDGKNKQVQVDVLIDYEGDLKLTISTELLINQPTPAFLILPIRMRITKLHIKGMLLQFILGVLMIAHIGESLQFSFKNNG